MTDLDIDKAPGGFEPYSSAMTPEEKQYPLNPTTRDAQV